MKKFIVLYRAPKGTWKQEEKTEEDMKEGMKAWMEWKERIGDGLVDMGAPLGNAHNINNSGHGKSDSDIAGYSILQAETMEVAGELLRGHPHFAWGEGCEIELFECMDIPK